jgi:phage-related minor tail protein
LTFYNRLFKSKASIGFVKDLLYASEIDRAKLRENLTEEEEKANKLFVDYMDKIIDNKPQKESAYNTRAAANPAEKKATRISWQTIQNPKRKITTTKRKQKHVAARSAAYTNIT